MEAADLITPTISDLVKKKLKADAFDNGFLMMTQLIEIYAPKEDAKFKNQGVQSVGNVTRQRIVGSYIQIWPRNGYKKSGQSRRSLARRKKDKDYEAYCMVQGYEYGPPETS